MQIIVLPGIYIGFRVTISGEAGKPIVFSAQAGAMILSASPRSNLPFGIEVWMSDFITIDGFTIDGLEAGGIAAYGQSTGEEQGMVITNNTCRGGRYWGIFTSFSKGVRIEGNFCEGSTEQHGIYHSNSADAPVIRNNNCINNKGAGIHMNGDRYSGGDGQIDAALIEGNTCEGNRIGINMDGVRNSTIRLNTLRGNMTGITVFWDDAMAPSSGNVITGNWIETIDNLGPCLLMRDGATGMKLNDNVTRKLDVNGYGCIEVHGDSMAGLVSDRNVFIGTNTATFKADDLTNPELLSLVQWQAKSGQDAHSVELRT